MPMPLHARRTLALLAIALVLLASLRTTVAQDSVVLPAAAPAMPEAPPAGFTDAEITTLAEIVTDLALAPDGRMLIALKGGAVRVVQNGSLQGSPALDLGGQGIICTEFERGLQSIAVDPNFASNQFVYIYHTYNGGSGGSNCGGRGDIINRVVRYTLSAGNVMSSPTVILNNIASPCGNHNGGDLHFDADGKLYVSTGDGGCAGSLATNNLARYRSVLNGKILRINPDGSIPADNPFANASGSVVCGASAPNASGGICRETYAWGFRNPFRFAIRAGTNQLYANDVGQNSREEISDVTAGNDYGWDCREGKQDNNTGGLCSPRPSNMIDPLYDYGHAAGLCSITGGAFAASAGAWPAPHDGAYFFGDYCGNAIYRLTNTNGTYGRSTFATVTGGNIVSLMFDSGANALYYTTSGGRVGRITYTGGGNRAPTAQISANPTSGPTPLAVQFSSAGSSDPDGDALTYSWNFGVSGATSTQANPSYTYQNAGTYIAVLVVTDARGASSPPAQITIDPGNTPPDAAILSPSSDARFVVGQIITLTGSANDAQDGDVTASMRWEVLLHHVPLNLPITGHTHPFFSGTGNNLAMPPMPPPEDLDAAPLSFLEVRLTARDSKGLARTITQTLQPERVALTFATEPSGLKLSVAGTMVTATHSATVWQNWALALAAPALQLDASGNAWRFASWSHGQPASHTLVVPASSATYTARYERVILSERAFLPTIHKKPVTAAGEE